MKYLKKYNENFFDKIEAAIKGKSEKGKIIADMLKKNNIPEKGYGYLFRYMGGDLTNESKSHPLSYLLSYKPNEGKLQLQNGKLVLTDTNLLNKKVVNIIPMLDKEEKEGIQEHGRIWSSSVIKFDYKFDLAPENPVFTISNSLLYDIDKGTWVNNELADSVNQNTPLDGVIDEEHEKELQDFFNGAIWNQDLLITYQNFIDECNKRQDMLKIITTHHKFAQQAAPQPQAAPQAEAAPQQTEPVAEKMKYLKKFK